MRKFSVAFILLFFVSSAPAFVKGPILIMPLGDSLTEGGYNENGVYKVGAGYRQELANLLWKNKVSFHFVGSLEHGPLTFKERRHEGHSGRRIDEMDQYALKYVKEFQPDIILLMIGTNDVAQNYNLPTASDRYSQWIDHIYEADPHARVIAASIIPGAPKEWQDRIRDYNESIQKVVERKKSEGRDITWADLFHSSRLSKSDLIDGVHPAPEGYRKLGRAWFEALKPLLGIKH